MQNLTILLGLLGVKYTRFLTVWQAYLKLKIINLAQFEYIFVAPSSKVNSLLKKNATFDHFIRHTKSNVYKFLA